MQPTLIETRRNITLPAWADERWRQYVGPIDVRLPAPVRRSARRPVKIPYAQWALENREVTEGAHPGRWRHEYAPHTVKIMDAFCQSGVEEVWLCKVEQSGGTNTMINLLLAATDCDPGDAFILMPTEKDSNKMIGRLKNTIKASRRVRDLVSPRADDTTLEKISLTNGVTWYPASAGSPASMSSRPAKYAFGDEVDKYTELAGREADPITLIRKRGRTFRGRVKRFFCSTPAGLFIYKGMKACAQVWEARVRCPHCGDLIKMDAEHLVIPEGATAENVDQLGVGYACNCCASIWTEQDRIDAIHAGAAHWHCVKGADVARPKSVGFHHRSWECLDVSLAEIAAAWLRAQGEDYAAKVDLAHGYLAEDYEAELAGVSEVDQILRFKSEIYARGVIPPDTACLVLLIDTQQSQFYYQGWAFGYAPQIKMHMFKHGIVESFDDLSGMLQQTYSDPDGREFRFEFGLIDSGGTKKGYQKHSRTVQVYDWCSRHLQVMPLKGMHGASGELITYKPIEVIPGSNKRYPPGCVPTRINARVNAFKDELANRLAMEPDDPGALSFHSDVDAAFARHYCSEGKDPKTGDWVHHRSKGRNDYFDCTNYAFVLRTILKNRIGRHPSEQVTAAAKKPTTAAPKKQQRRRW